MNGGRDQPAVAGYEVLFSRTQGCLVARISGRIPTIEDTIAMLMQVSAERLRTPTKRVLMLDDSEGVVPDEAGFMRIIAALQDRGFVGARIAFVDCRGGGLGQVEIGEILARDAGYDLRVFTTEAQARLWLHYGEK